MGERSVTSHITHITPSHILRDNIINIHVSVPIRYDGVQASMACPHFVPCSVVALTCDFTMPMLVSALCLETMMDQWSTVSAGLLIAGPVVGEKCLMHIFSMIVHRVGTATVPVMCVRNGGDGRKGGKERGREGEREGGRGGRGGEGGKV